MGIKRLKSDETIWVKGEEFLGPVTLAEPADKSICDLVRSTAAQHANWGPLRIYEELLDDGNSLTEENVHWVMREYGLREYVTAGTR